MNIESGLSYRFARGERTIFSEIYFPKKGAYQAEIYGALEDGLTESKVVRYLTEKVDLLRHELSEYPQLLDPKLYERKTNSVIHPVSKEDSLERIKMYKGHFKGWSMYEVDGVFAGENGTDEERTQVVRLILRISSTFLDLAVEAGCYDVLDAIITWTLGDNGRIDNVFPWSSQEKKRFIAFHNPWIKQKRAFVDQHFEAISKEVKKWIDDSSLLIFGFLVRRFWNSVIAKGKVEEEIWVTSFLNLNVNIVKRVSSNR